MNIDSDETEYIMAIREKMLKSDIELPHHVKAMLYSGLWESLLVGVKRTVKVTTSQKVQTYHAMVAVGNMEGMFGVGMGSTSTANGALEDAHANAFSRLIYVPLYRQRTLYHRIEHRFRTIKVILMPRPEGYGQVCSDFMSELCELIGIEDISIKIQGRRRKNKFNLVKCFMEAVQRQTLPHDGVEGKGVYVREVYSGHKLPFNIQRLPDGRIEHLKAADPNP